MQDRLLTSKVREARLMLHNYHITFSSELNKLLEAHPMYADDLAIALIYLHKCDIFLSTQNISDIAMAGRHAEKMADKKRERGEEVTDVGHYAWDLTGAGNAIDDTTNPRLRLSNMAIQIAWFATVTNSHTDIMNTLITALVTTKNIVSSVQALALMQCFTKLTDDLIYKVTQQQDPIAFVKLAFAAKNQSTMESKTTPMTAPSASIDEEEIAIFHIQPRDSTNLTSNSFLRPPRQSHRAKSDFLYAHSAHPHRDNQLSQKRSQSHRR